jgi:intein/homing endonuclease
MIIAGTQIKMANSTTKNVEDVQVGDKLKGYNTKYVSVTGTIADQSNEYYIINNRLKITGDHAVLTNRGRMVRADELIIGGEGMIRFDGTTEDIISVSTVQGNTPTYNFTVQGNNLYIADDIVVGT